jgi:hypothetical protein
MVATQAANRVVAPPMACRHRILVIELDPSAPAPSLFEAWHDPQRRRRLVIDDEGGAGRHLRDTLLSGPVLLVIDEGGLIVGDPNRAWPSRETVAWPVYLRITARSGRRTQTRPRT